MKSDQPNKLNVQNRENNLLPEKLAKFCCFQKVCQKRVLGLNKNLISNNNFFVDQVKRDKRFESTIDHLEKFLLE